MELVFNKKDMIAFVKWYDSKPESKCHETFEQELTEWLTLQNTSHNSDYTKLPKLSDIVKELEKTGWLHPEYKGIAIEENRYNGIEVVLNMIKKLGNFA